MTHGYGIGRDGTRNEHFRTISRIRRSQEKELVYFFLVYFGLDLHS